MLSVAMFLGGVCLGKGELSERDDDSHVGEGETSGVMALRFCLVSRRSAPPSSVRPTYPVLLFSHHTTW